MDHLKRLIVCALLAWSSSAMAGFAQLAPPAGWGGGPGSYTMSSSANAATFNGGFSGPGGSMNIGGKAVTMPAAYRFAANAGRFAAGFMFRNSAIGLTAMGIAYIANECIGVIGGQWKIICGPELGRISDGYTYVIGGLYISNFPQDTCNLYGAAMAVQQTAGGGGAVFVFESATLSGSAGDVTRGCAAVVRVTVAGGGYPVGWTGTYNQIVRRVSGPCPAGWYWTDGGVCTQTVQPIPVSEPDFIERIAPKPIPADLPKVIPGPWPVEIPVINPTPGSNPLPRPMVVPDGLPRPVPNSDPQQWEQPGIRISPAPTPSAPWQVEVEPIKTPVPGPEASPEPYTPGEQAPESTPDETDDLCKNNPDIVACQKLGDAPVVPVANEERQMSVKKDSGWGASDAQCPAPRQLHFVGRTVDLPLDMVCQFARGIRPFMIGFAWFIAAGMFYGFMRKG